MFIHPFNINDLNNTKKLLHSKEAKIHILGGAGSGKTTMANTLSARLSIPHYDLDDIYWHPAKKIYQTAIVPQRSTTCSSSKREHLDY